MRAVLRGAELVGLFIALCLAGILYEVFVAPDERERRDRRIAWDD